MSTNETMMFALNSVTALIALLSYIHNVYKK